MGKSCPWIEDYPILRPNFYRVFIWTRVVSVSRMTFVSLQARAKVFTREKVISPPPGVTLSRKRGDPTPRMTLPPGWPYPQGDLTPRVTLPPGWPYPQGNLTPRVTLPQGWPYPQGDLTPRVTLPPGWPYLKGDPTLLFICIPKITGAQTRQMPDNGEIVAFKKDTTIQWDL